MLKFGCWFCVIMILLTSCTKEDTLFSKMFSNETGINFENTITESDSLNIFTFEYIYNGGGVGIGDVNNDGLQDVFFTGNMVSSKLYLNEGNFKFNDITEKSNTTTKAWCTGVAMIDINEDGRLDIYVSTAFPSKDKKTPNLLFINKGNDKTGIPIFEEAAAKVGLADSSYCSQSAFFDYDRDGDLDVYLCINTDKESDRNQLRGQRTDGKGLSQDKLYRNDGLQRNGLPHFTDVSQHAGINIEGWGLGVIVKDFNHDDWPDIYVANDYQSNDHLYINNKNGTFTNKISEYLSHQCLNAMGVDMADINNDGLEDLCVVDMLPNDNMRYKSMFGTIPNDKYNEALQRGYQPQFVRNVLQLNTGPRPDSPNTSSFSDIGYLAGIAATDWSWSPLFADFDMDGNRDLLITNGYVKDITDLDFATFANENRMFGTSEANRRRLDEKAKELGEVKKQNYLFKNNGDLTFTNKADAWGLNDLSFSNGAAYADLDNDGDLDIVVNNLNDKAFIYRNNSANKAHRKKQKTGNSISIQLKGNRGNRQGIGAKVKLWYGTNMQYAEQALQRGYLSSVDERINFGIGRAEKIDSLKIFWPSGKMQLLKNIAVNKMITLREEWAHVENSGTSTKRRDRLLVKSDKQPDYLHEENDYLDFNYQYTLPHKYSIQGPGLAVADVNGDGQEDVYVAGSSRHSGYFLFQKGTGFIKKPLINNVGNKEQEETGVLLFDADNDGDNDLYCVAGGNEFSHAGAYQDMLYLNNGRGNFSNASQSLPNTEGSGSCITACDFDKDGDLDLFIGGRNIPHQYPLAGISYLLRNDSQPNAVKFTDVTTLLCPQVRNCGMITSSLWSDYDNDGFTDLLVAGEFMPLEIYRNLSGKSFKKLTTTGLENTAGWYNSITGADFDNDGDIDYVLGNLGLNSRYKASLQEPVTVRFNDFNKDGALDAFLFSYSAGVEYPTQPRNTFLDQISVLKKKIYYYHDFGKMGYKDIFTEEERRGAKELKAFQMSSLYIENSGAGKFISKALPVESQTAPMNGVLAIDVNQDNNLDLIAIGNSYAPEALTGRYDASRGWVLLGNGKGSFKSLRGEFSGFDLKGDGRALVKLNKNGKSLIMAARNSGALETFYSRYDQPCLSLQKDDSYIIYTFENGKKRKEELYRGSSYLSQSGRFFEVPEGVKTIEIFNLHDKSRKLTF